MLGLRHGRAHAPGIGPDSDRCGHAGRGKHH
jgi:hypothetical protein